MKSTFVVLCDLKFEAVSLVALGGVQRRLAEDKRGFPANFGFGEARSGCRVAVNSCTPETTQVNGIFHCVRQRPRRQELCLTIRLFVLQAVSGDLLNLGPVQQIKQKC